MSVLVVLHHAIQATEKAWGEQLEGILLDTLVASAKASAKKLKTLRAAAPGVKGFAFDVTNPNATAWAKAQAADLITGVSEATREEIRDLVEASFAEQFDVDQLADDIAEIVGDDDRAEKIARTESMRAANEGQQQLWEQATEAGVLTGLESKVWITTPDDRLCPVCEPLDGQTVALDDTFDVDGDSIDAPPAHPNCRCTMGLTT